MKGICVIYLLNFQGVWNVLAKLESIYKQFKSPIFNFIRYHRIKLAIFILWYRIKSIPLQKRKETVKKHYLVDNGLLHLFINNPDTLLLENLCAITLYKKYGESLFYFNKSIEVDFYVPDEGLAIQASYRMSDKTTLEREMRALKALHSFKPLTKAIIITYENEGILEYKGLEIEVKPIWKWVLDSQ